jgi:hypothetical protein
MALAPSARGTDGSKPSHSSVAVDVTSLPFPAALSSLASAEASVSRLCVSVAQLLPPCTNEAAVARSVDSIKKQLATLEAQVEALRSRALDDPELLEAEQQRKLHTIEQHASAVQESVGRKPLQRLI